MVDPVYLEGVACVHYHILRHACSQACSLRMEVFSSTQHSPQPTTTTSCTKRSLIFKALVLSASGGLAKEATNFYKRLASLLADKWDQPYSQTMNWLRCRISFALLRSAIQCIRGARSSRGHAILSPVDLVTAEAHINHL